MEKFNAINCIAFIPRDHNLLSNITAHDLNLPSSKKIFRQNNTNSLSCKPTIPKKIETTSFEKKESSSSHEHVVKRKLNNVEKRINDMKNVIQSIKKKNSRK